MIESRYFYNVEPEEAGLRLDQCLARAFADLSRRQAREQLANGSVCLNGKPVRVLSRRVFAGDRITWFPSKEKQSSHIDWTLYDGPPVFAMRDASLAVLVKPSGIATEPTRGEDLRTCLRQMEAVLRIEGVHSSKAYVAAVHRLDTQASGLVALALSKPAAAHLSAQFAARTAGRTYHALVSGCVEGDTLKLEDFLAKVGPRNRHGVVTEERGKHAVTHVKVLERFGERASWVEVQLETGRTHQIRVQMSAAGYPLLGDRLYGERDTSVQRLMLHARKLVLTHPKNEERIELEAKLPEDFVACLEQLRTPS